MTVTMTATGGFGVLAGAAGALAAVWGLALALGAVRWRAANASLVAQLEAAREPLALERVDFRELEGLPDPVQRFFRAVMTNGQPIVRRVEIGHSGSFNLSASGPMWRPFTSQQVVSTRRPGFVWNGRVSMLPGVPVRVHDAYVAGVGCLRPAVLGLVPLADAKPTPELARGELLRWFAEAAWYPTALLPSQGVRWRALDAGSAEATLVDGSVEVSLRFRFGADGRIDSVRAEARGRGVGDAVVMTPWEGRFSDPECHDGLWVPMRGEVAWLTPQGRLPYWRGQVTRLVYDVGDRGDTQPSRP
jgi:hypothetical protein